MNTVGQPDFTLGHLRALVFDVGETIVDETREYGTWADWLGVPRHTFSSVFGAVIKSGGDYRQTFNHFEPGFDLERERVQRIALGQAEWFGEDDLYPDVRSSLAAIKNLGYVVGLAGNQTHEAHRLLSAMDLPVDFVATSASLGFEKPSGEFYQHIIETCGVAPESIGYVGDRLDNDVRPARAAGLVAIHILRGPWAHIVTDDAGEAHLTIKSLNDLADLLMHREY